MKLIVGLTGGIGSGKSRVGQQFESHGIVVVDTDAISRTLTAHGGAAIEPIRDQFGDAFIDATCALDRARMREMVFSDPLAKRKLEKILHPMIRAESDRLVAGANSPYVILMIPLLVESGAPHKRCHLIAVVDCPEEMQIERVMSRDGLTRAQVVAIMNNQASRKARLAIADDVIDNSGPASAIAQRVTTLHDKYVGLAASQIWHALT